MLTLEDYINSKIISNNNSNDNKYADKINEISLYSDKIILSIDIKKYKELFDTDSNKLLTEELVVLEIIYYSTTNKNVKSVIYNYRIKDLKDIVDNFNSNFYN